MSHVACRWCRSVVRSCRSLRLPPLPVIVYALLHVATALPRCHGSALLRTVLPPPRCDSLPPRSRCPRVCVARLLPHARCLRVRVPYASLHRAFYLLLRSAACYAFLFCATPFCYLRALCLPLDYCLPHVALRFTHAVACRCLPFDALRFLCSPARYPYHCCRRALIVLYVAVAAPATFRSCRFRSLRFRSVSLTIRRCVTADAAPARYRCSVDACRSVHHAAAIVVAIDVCRCDRYVPDDRYDTPRRDVCDCVFACLPRRTTCPPAAMAGRGIHGWRAAGETAIHTQHAGIVRR